MTLVRSVFVSKLSADLIKEYNVHSMPLRKGDTVMVMRGAFRDVEGKVTRTSRKKVSVYIEGVTKEKSDGSTIFLPVNPSKVMLTKLNLDDKWRKKILARKASKPAEEAPEKPQTRTRRRKKEITSPGEKKNQDEE